MKYKSTTFYSNRRYKMKNYALYSAIALLLIATSCGTSVYHTSTFEDGIYYTPEQSSREVLAQQDQTLQALVQETDRNMIQWSTDALLIQDTPQGKDTSSVIVNLNFEEPDWRYSGWYSPWYGGWHSPWYYGPDYNWSFGVAFNFGWGWPYYPHYTYAGPFGPYGPGWYDPWFGPYAPYPGYYDPWYYPWYGPGYGPGPGPAPRTQIYGKRETGNNSLRGSAMSSITRNNRPQSEQPQRIRRVERPATATAKEPTGKEAAPRYRRAENSSSVQIHKDTDTRKRTTATEYQRNTNQPPRQSFQNNSNNRSSSAYRNSNSGSSFRSGGSTGGSHRSSGGSRR